MKLLSVMENLAAGLYEYFWEFFIVPRVRSINFAHVGLTLFNISCDSFILLM